MREHPDPPDAAASGPGGATRVAFAGALALLAVILFTSARVDPGSDDVRVGRRVELLELIRAEQARVEQLSAQVDELSDEVSRVEATAAAGAVEAESVQTELREVAAPAGMTAVRGPGLVVSLEDSLLSSSSSGDYNDLIIHEEDLQAVINALWAGGTEAMSVNGERILSTTAIRCVGNTLLLHGNVYSPPYVIEAIGDDGALTRALGRDHLVARFAAAASEHELGFDVAAEDELLVPAYEGGPGLQVARPAGTSDR